MDGPTSGGDGIVMYNDTRGAVALQHDDNASVINTIRLTRTQWNDVKEAENKTTADQLKSKTKRFTDGFDKFSCSKGALAGNPWICTAWQPTWEDDVYVPEWSAAGTATKIDMDMWPRFGPDEVQYLGTIDGNSMTNIVWTTWTIPKASTGTVAGAWHLAVAAIGAATATLLAF